MVRPDPVLSSCVLGARSKFLTETRFLNEVDFIDLGAVDTNVTDGPDIVTLTGVV